MQTGEADFKEQGVVIAPDPSRCQYDIEIPWLTRGEGEHSTSLENLDPGALRVLFHDPAAVYSGWSRASVENNDHETESSWTRSVNHGLPSDIIVSDIVAKIVRNTGINESDHHVSRVVREYLEKRCFGKQLVLNDHAATLQQLDTGLSDYIARHLSQEIVQKIYNPVCVNLTMSATRPFTWMHDDPLIKAGKTIFNYVATSHAYERSFAMFLDRCVDVHRFTSLGVAEQGSLVIRGQDGFSPSSMLPYDPDWVVVHYHNGDIRYWIVGTKHYSSTDDARNELMTKEWCKIATQATGDSWRYMSVRPDIDFERFSTFQGLIVDNVCRALSALAATQTVSTSLDEIREMRDEGRRTWNW